MIIKCVLYARDGARQITETEISTRSFSALSDNPFPASDLTTVICLETRTIAVYRVIKAKEMEAA